MPDFGTRKDGRVYPKEGADYYEGRRLPHEQTRAKERLFSNIMAQLNLARSASEVDSINLAIERYRSAGSITEAQWKLLLDRVEHRYRSLR